MNREPVLATPRRSMTPARRLRVLERYEHRCAEPTCAKPLTDKGDCIVDHILPLELGGADTDGNCQPLCIPCDKAKTKFDRARIDKMRRQSRMDAPREPSRLRSRGFSTGWTKHMDGTVTRREVGT